ncbi:MAG: hypothetical protein K6E53_16775 [Lachnospiraceae bacterium]|nr:hypothetical protein [Lachnospiraceae bacterium]
MRPVDAIYVRMSSLLSELGTVSKRMCDELASLKDRLKYLGISWEGSAYDEYMRVLSEDIMLMEMTAYSIQVMYRLLNRSLTRYQETEMKVYDIIGGMGR